MFLLIKKKLQVHELTIKDFKRVDARINDKIFNFISLEKSVINRKSVGGTSPLNVEKEIIFAKEKWLNY